MSGSWEMVQQSSPAPKGKPHIEPRNSHVLLEMTETFRPTLSHGMIENAGRMA